MKKLFLVVIILLAAAGVAAADTIYLRDGRTVQGTLIGFVNGQFVVRVTSIGTGNVTSSRSETGELQYFRPNEVERVEIDGRSLNEQRYETRTVQVPLESNWIDSGVDVRRGERIQMKASGVIVAGRTRISPDGIRSNDPSAPLPGAAEGMLIAAIGSESNSPVIEIGSSREFAANRDGRIFLTANRSSYADARGSFTVEIRREIDLAANSDDNIFDRRRRPGVRSRRPQTGTGIVRPSELTLEVPGTTRVDNSAVDTGIDVRSGDQLTITATGRVIAGRRIGEVGPEGGRSSGFGSIIGTRPVPTVGAGALIGYLRLADGQVTPAFLIGPNLVLNPTQEGRLFLAINDDDYTDNGGSFTVRIRRQ
jgi:hypothetical protein